jgi:hypothetical protein
MMMSYSAATSSRIDGSGSALTDCPGSAARAAGSFGRDDGFSFSRCDLAVDLH